LPAVYLDAITMKRESKSYVDSLHAVLTAAGLFQGPKHMLSGLTGMAFKLSVHKRLLPLSVTAYGQWGDEHRPAVDNIGLYTAWDGGRSRHPSFCYYQQDAIKWIKQSLDQGIGVIYWIPEFGVIHGYDDEDGVFFVQDGWSREDIVVLYDNLGLNWTGFWYCQVFGDKAEVPQEDMVLESVRLAIYDWQTPHKALPDKEIASGKLAYTFLTEGLRSGQFDESGAVYILDSYLYARAEIRDYLGKVQPLWSELASAYALYQELVHVTSEIGACIYTLKDGSRRVDRSRVDDIVVRLRRAEALEEEAVACFQALSSRYSDKKRSVIPRWGASSPR